MIRRARGVARALVLGTALVATGSLVPQEPPGTWSIAAVDYPTGQIGIAGASCTTNVQGIGEVIPGVGVVVVQGMSSDAARSRGMELMRSGTGSAEILEAMRDPDFNPEDQQYAVVLLDSTQSPMVYTGTGTDGARVAATAAGVAVQGNSLAHEAVVEGTLSTFLETTAPLASRLVGALAGGDTLGGDKRCGEQRARSAFVTVYNPDDPDPRPYFHLVVYGIPKGGQPAVPALVQEFAEIFPRSEDRTTTRIYVIPEKK